MITMSRESDLDHSQDLSMIYTKSSILRRNNSGELDVFEAANYFSAYSNISDQYQSSLNSINQAQRLAGSPMIIDAPAKISHSRSPLDPTRTGRLMQIRVAKEKMVSKKHPSSPGGRLASFLTSLFNHAEAKKKNNKSMQDDPKPRMRRSSISHVDSKSLSAASATLATGFSTPPPVYKFFDDSKSVQDHHHKRVTPPPSLTKLTVIENKVKSSTWLDHKVRIRDHELPALEKFRRNSTNGLFKGQMGDEFEFNQVENIVKDFELKKVIEDVDKDGGESDASSDLFELQNCRLGEFSSELPVYETTKFEPKRLS